MTDNQAIPSNGDDDRDEIEAKLTKDELARLHFRWLAKRAFDYSNQVAHLFGEMSPLGQKEWDYAITVAEEWKEVADTIKGIMRKNGQWMVPDGDDEEATQRWLSGPASKKDDRTLS